MLFERYIILIYISKARFVTYKIKYFHLLTVIKSEEFLFEQKKKFVFNFFPN